MINDCSDVGIEFLIQWHRDWAEEIRETNGSYARRCHHLTTAELLAELLRWRQADDGWHEEDPPPTQVARAGDAKDDVPDNPNVPRVRPGKGDRPQHKPADDRVPVRTRKRRRSDA